MKSITRKTPFVLFLLLPLAGCGDETTKPEESSYLPRTSEANVLNNLQVSYLKKEIAPYAAILADDFKFYFDEGTRQQNHNLPVFWTRLEDSTQTEALFEAPEVTDIRVALTFDPVARAVNEAGRAGWTSINVVDTFLEVDTAPRSGEIEGITFRVDGQQQRFYFRKGKSPADTLVTSATSGLFYLVEWRDYGMEDGSAVRPEPNVAATWGRMGGSGRTGR